MTQWELIKEFLGTFFGLLLIAISGYLILMLIAIGQN